MTQTCTSRCPSPSKREFEVMPFSDRQSHNSFSIYLVNRVVKGHIPRGKLVYLDTEFEKLWSTHLLNGRNRSRNGKWKVHFTRYYSVTILRKKKICIFPSLGTAVAQWLRCFATIRKVAGSIPAGVGGLFIDIKSLWSHYGPGVDSASNRNEYQEYFLGVKAAGA